MGDGGQDFAMYIFCILLFSLPLCSTIPLTRNAFSSGFFEDGVTRNGAKLCSDNFTYWILSDFCRLCVIQSNLTFFV